MDELPDVGRGAMLLLGGGCALLAVMMLIPTPPAARHRASAEISDASSRARPGIARRVRSRLGRRRGRRSSGETLRRDVAELLRQLAALLQSGRSPGQAWGDLRDHWGRLGESHPLAAVCADVARAEAAGDGAAVGLRRAGRRTRDQAAALGLSPDGVRAVGEVLDRLRGAVALSEETGAPLAELARRLAAAAEEDAELHAAIRTAVAGPQTTQLILVLLPLAGVGLGQAMGADAASLLFDGGVGTGCLVLGTALLAAGWWWGRGMIRAAMTHG